MSRSGRANGNGPKPPTPAHRARVEMFKRLAGEGSLDERCHRLCVVFAEVGVLAGAKLEPTAEDRERARGVPASVHELRPPDETPRPALFEMRERLPA
jgi:hypothetical protein